VRCLEIQALLVDYLYRDLAETDSLRVEEHLAVCSLCRQEYSALTTTLRLLDASRDTPIPAGLWEKVKAVVAQEEAGRFQTWRQRVGARKALLQSLAPFGAGILVAAGSLFLLRGYITADGLSFLTELVLAALWAGLLGAAFHLALPGRGWAIPMVRETGAEVQGPARAALVGMGLTCFFLSLLPILSILQRVGLGSEIEHADHSVALLGIFFLVGLGYSTLSLFFGGFLFGRRAPRISDLSAVVTAYIYVVVMAPGLAIVCIPFSVWVFFSILGGSAMGGIAGAALGFWAASRV